MVDSAVNFFSPQTNSLGSPGLLPRNELFRELQNAPLSDPLSGGLWSNRAADLSQTLPLNLVSSPALATPLPAGVFTVGSSGQLSIDYLVDGGAYTGEVGIFSMEGLEAASFNTPEFFLEAARRSASNSELGYIVISDGRDGARFNGDFFTADNFNSGSYRGTQTFTMRPGDRFGLMLIPHGTVQDFLTNPAGEASLRPLFSLAEANPNQAVHLGQIVDNTGNSRILAFEDIRTDGNSDRDFNDLVLQMGGATGGVPLLDDLIASTRDWRNTELGLNLLEQTGLTASQTGQLETLVFGSLAENLMQSLATELEQVQQQFQAGVAAAQANPLASDPTPDATELQTQTFFSQLEANFAEMVNRLPGDPVAAPETVANPFPRSQQPLIGVIDTGFSPLNPGISPGRLLLGRDWVENDNNPLTGDASREHGTQVLNVIAASRSDGIGIDGINDTAPLWLGRAVGSGQWAASLREFVDTARASGQPNAVVNLSFDLTQIAADGSISTRDRLTREEWDALEYARQNQVMVVVAAGNEGGAMSALGQASQAFDNVITVGAAENWQRADYSSYGAGLDLVADGVTAASDGAGDFLASLNPAERGSFERGLKIATDLNLDSLDEAGVAQVLGQQANLQPSETDLGNLIGAIGKILQALIASLQGETATGVAEVLGEAVEGMVGTSIAAARVTGAASLLWAMKPELSYLQIKELLKKSAIDLGAPGPDLETGTGMLNLPAALQLAGITAPLATDPADLTPDAALFSSEAAVPGESPVGFFRRLFKKAGKVIRKVGGWLSKAGSVFKKITEFIPKVMKVFTWLGCRFPAFCRVFAGVNRFLGGLGRFTGKLAIWLPKIGGWIGTGVAVISGAVRVVRSVIDLFRRRRATPTPPPPPPAPVVPPGDQALLNTWSQLPADLRYRFWPFVNLNQVSAALRSAFTAAPRTAPAANPLEQTQVGGRTVEQWLQEWNNAPTQRNWETHPLNSPLYEAFHPLFIGVPTSIPPVPPDIWALYYLAWSPLSATARQQVGRLIQGQIPAQFRALFT